MAFRILATHLKECFVAACPFPCFALLKRQKYIFKHPVLDDPVLNFQERYPQAVSVTYGDKKARIGSWELHKETDECVENSDKSASLCTCTHFTSLRVSQAKTVNPFDTLS